MRVVVTSSHSTLSLRCFTCTNPFAFYLTYSIIPFLHSSMIQLLYISHHSTYSFLYFIGTSLTSSWVQISIMSFEFWYMFVTIGISPKWIYAYFLICSNLRVFWRGLHKCRLLDNTPTWPSHLKWALQWGLVLGLCAWFGFATLITTIYVVFSLCPLESFLDIFLYVLHNTLPYILLVPRTMRHLITSCLSNIIS